MLLSSRKRYLSGSDWVVNTLDRVMKQVTCAGNMSQIVLSLAEFPDEDRLRYLLTRFLERLPVVNGTVARDLRLAPYWRIPSRGCQQTVLRVASDVNSLQAACEQSANRPFGTETEHVAFNLFSNGTDHALAMSFDHRLLDARGAETMLDYLWKTLDTGVLPEEPVFSSSAHLSRWKEKFLAGQKVNRRIIALADKVPRALSLPADQDRAYRYRVISCSEEQTETITERAYSEAGYLMESSFLLAVVTVCMHRLFEARQESAENYLVPVTVDLRTGKGDLHDAFFNHLSYLFYKIPAVHGADRAKMIESIKTQMYEQIKSNAPADLARASLLMRIAPLSILGRLLYLPLEGKMASFAFAHLGESGYNTPEFMGSKVNNLFHMPRVPLPPGIGFFCNRFHGRLNVVMATLDGLLTDQEADSLETNLRNELGVSPS